MTDLLSYTPVKARVWSPQQQAFLDWCANGEGSCVLEAVAGAGKTTTIIAAAGLIPGQCALVVYNKKNADEFKGKLRDAGIDWQKAQGGTVHSFGFSGFKNTFGKDVKVNGKKVYSIIDRLYPRNPYASVVANLVSLAKQRALGVLGSIEDVKLWYDIIDHFDVLDDLEDGVQVAPSQIIGMAQAVLTASNGETKEVDFDDMVYLPVLLKCKIWRYDVVFVDEAQDTNPARRALVRAMVKEGGRVIAVGDSRQAIYGFTGADADALELIAKDFDCIRMPLTVSYRCPQAVVRFAHRWVSHIEAHPDAPMGAVSTIDSGMFMALIPEADASSTAILSRTNKPLVELAFRLIRNRVPCRVEGREIGTGLKKLAQKWKRPQDLNELVERLDEYLDVQTTKLLAQGKEDRVQALQDQVETLKVLIEECQSKRQYRMEDLLASIDSLFGDDVANMIVLSSIHKSKGREWNTVYWLDRAGTCPSKWARQSWQQEQEKNLCYVAATRAKQQLIEIEVVTPLAK